MNITRAVALAMLAAPIATAAAEEGSSVEDRLRALTADQVNAAFRKYIEPDKLTFVVAGDAKKGIK